MGNKVAVLLTCFNRKELTLNCIEMLHKQQSDDYRLDYYLVNDGCTDGTEKAVAINFSEVNIIKGDGSLLWSGGMRLARN